MQPCDRRACSRDIRNTEVTSRTDDPPPIQRSERKSKKGLKFKFSLF